RPSSLTRRPAGVMMVGTTNPFRADEIMKHLSCLFFLSITVVCVLLLPGGAARPAEQEPYDLVLRNGTVVDGSGNPWFRGDVAIRGDRIVAVGRVPAAQARREIDVKGLVVAPGFIDMHSHSDFVLLEDGDAPSKVRQGVTTEVLGEGLSAAPCRGKMTRRGRKWPTLAAYFDEVER